MARKSKAATIRRGAPTRNDKRDEQIRAYRGRGWTYKRLADKYELSLSRITQILRAA
jgi:Mor family transcriptional regulator